MYIYICVCVCVYLLRLIRPSYCRVPFQPLTFQNALNNLDRSGEYLESTFRFPALPPNLESQGWKMLKAEKLKLIV